MGRLLMIVGASLFLAGLVWHFGGKWGIGHLPGDLRFERNNLRVFIPLGTSIVLSVAVSLVFWLFRRFWS